jgi:hypothetical protein
MKVNDILIIKKARWYHLLWHRILTALGKEAYAWMKDEVIEQGPYTLVLDHVWLCPGCMRYMSWDRGCAHDDPKLARLCDDCFVKGGHLAKEP